MATVMRKVEIAQDDWLRCYRDNWQGVITPDAFAHPAKFARGLIRRIYDHCQEEGWLTEGQTVIDPFGGVALGGLEAALRGCHWRGVELEARFVQLGNENINLWENRYQGRMPKWGSVRLVQGDSRELAKVIEGAELCVSSPPYASQPTRNGGELTGWKTNKRIGASQNCNEGYGKTPGQLGSMKEGDFTLAISSPPFVESLASDEPTNGGGLFRDEKRKNDKTLTATYGETSGQLGGMKEGAFDAAISSPPFAGSLAGEPRNDNSVLGQMQRGENKTAGGRFGKSLDNVYSVDPSNLGNSQGDSFWTAAREILEQLYSVLSPDAHAVFVLKDFIRNKQRVPFCSQWARLCEAVGFELLHIHHAWLVDHRGTQARFDGGSDELKVEKKSFFRLLAERKGSPRIDYETVMCFGKA